MANLRRTTNRGRFLSGAAAFALAAALPNPAPAAARALQNYTTGTRGVLVVHKASHLVLFRDAATLEETHRIDLGTNPHELVISPDRKRAYVTIYGSGIYGGTGTHDHRIAILDLAARALEGYIDIAPLESPHSLMFDAAGLLWVTCESSARAGIIDTARKRVVATVPTGSTGSHFSTMLPDGSRFFISNKDKGYVSVIDVASRSVIKTIHYAGGTDGLCTTINGRFVFVNDLLEPVMHIVNARTLALERSITLADQAGHAARVRVSLDGTYVVTSNLEKALATVMPMHDLHVQKTFAVDKAPMGFAFPARPDRALVADHDSEVISEIDLAAGAVLRTIPGPKGAETLTYF